MSKKCKAYSVSKLGLEPADNRKAFYAGWNAALAEQPAQQQEPVTHCEAGPEYCPVCLAETRSLTLAAAVGYVQRNTPQLVSEEICRALNKSSPPASKPWVSLTDEEVLRTLRPTVWAHVEGHHREGMLADARAIEAKLREKNA